MGGGEVDAALNRVAGDDTGTGDGGGEAAAGVVFVDFAGVEADGVDGSGERGQGGEVGAGQAMPFMEEAAAVGLDLLGDDGAEDVARAGGLGWVEDEGVHGLVSPGRRESILLGKTGLTLGKLVND